MSTINQAVPLFLAILIGLLQLKMPALARPDLFFSVTVRPQFRTTEIGRTVARRYALQVLLHSLFALGLLALGVWKHTSWLVVVGMAWQVCGPAAALVSAHARVLPHRVAPSTVREATLARRERPRSLAPALGPFVILASAAAWCVWHAGHSDSGYVSAKGLGWYGRSLAGLNMYWASGAAACAFVLALRYAVPRLSRSTATTDEATRAEDRFATLTAAVLTGASYIVALSFALTAVASVQGYASAASAIVDVAAIGFVLTTFLFYAKIGQGGSRAMTHEQLDAPKGDRTDDARWKLGLFYYNPADPALFVEKRFGLGHTVNLANRWSWVVLGLIALLIVALARVKY